MNDYNPESLQLTDEDFCICIIVKTTIPDIFKPNVQKSAPIGLQTGPMHFKREISHLQNVNIRTPLIRHIDLSHSKPDNSLNSSFLEYPSIPTALLTPPTQPKTYLQPVIPLKPESKLSVFYSQAVDYTNPEFESKTIKNTINHKPDKKETSESGEVLKILPNRSMEEISKEQSKIEKPNPHFHPQHSYTCNSCLLLSTPLCNHKLCPIHERKFIKKILFLTKFTPLSPLHPCPTCSQTFKLSEAIFSTIQFSKQKLHSTYTSSQTCKSCESSFSLSLFPNHSCDHLCLGCVFTYHSLGFKECLFCKSKLQPPNVSIFCCKCKKNEQNPYIYLCTGHFHCVPCCIKSVSSEKCSFCFAPLKESDFRRILNINAFRN